MYTLGLTFLTFFFLNDTAPTEIYPLPLHAALPISADAGTAFAPGLRYYYYRELQAEPPIPFEAEVLHRDAHLLVADKPHFLPVVPAGKYLQQKIGRASCRERV